jgi:hypothetical protein
LLTWEKPQLDDTIANVESNPCLNKAFNFVPGQKISFTVTEKNKPPYLLTWETEIDLYNNTYLHCTKTGSKAFFRNEPDLHYFTWFHGDRKSVLYAFYLGAFKVARGFYPGLLIQDEFPLFTMQKGIRKVLQDFVAPFHIFVHSEYRMEYQSMDDEIGQTKINLKSTLIEQTSMGSKQQAEFFFIADNNRIEKFTILRKGRKITADYYPDPES